MSILRRVEEGVDKPKPKVLFEPGEVVRVIDGPFNDFNGVVETVNYEKNRLQVAVPNPGSLHASRVGFQSGGESLTGGSSRVATPSRQ